MGLGTVCVCPPCIPVCVRQDQDLHLPKPVGDDHSGKAMEKGEDVLIQPGLELVMNNRISVENEWGHCLILCSGLKA